jgi:hypothetical protein
VSGGDGRTADEGVEEHGERRQCGLGVGKVRRGRSLNGVWIAEPARAYDPQRSMADRVRVRVRPFFLLPRPPWPTFRHS